MPLPAARHTLPYVDSSRGQRPGAEPRAYAQINRLLWRGELRDGEIFVQLVQHIRCSNIRDIPQVVAAPSYAQQTYGGRPG